MEAVIIHAPSPSGTGRAALCGERSGEIASEGELITCRKCYRIRESLAESPSHLAGSRQVGGSHYKDLQVEPWDVIRAWQPPSFPGFAIFLWGNAIKYLSRLGRKGDPVEDIDKTIHYLEKLKEEIRDAQ